MSRLVKHITSEDHVLGNPNARTEVVEYLDYQCPYCRAANGVVAELLTRFAKEIRYAARHFPLTRIHPNALLAAQAAEAAGTQRKYWQMHQMLFDNQDALEIGDLLAYAQALALDVRLFAQELEDGRHLPKVRADFESGLRSGVNGTPTFFIDGLRADSWDLDSLSAAIEDSLSAGRGAPV